MIKIKVSDYGYDLGVKDQCHMYLKSVSCLVTKTPLSMFHIRHNGCVDCVEWCVNYNKAFRSGRFQVTDTILESKGNVKQ